MQFLVGKKEHNLTFGIGFLRQLDEKYFVEDSGMKFGQGLQKATIGLLDQNIPTLADVIQAAIEAPVSMKQIEAGLGAYAEEHDGFDRLFDEVIEGLKGSSFTKAKVVKIQNLIEEATKKATENN